MEKATQLFKALSDEKRYRIIHMLRNGELCACELESSLELTQSGLSYHMKILYDCGLVLKRPEGNWIFYRINPEYGDVIALVDLIGEKYKVTL